MYDSVFLLTLKWYTLRAYINIHIGPDIHNTLMHMC